MPVLIAAVVAAGGLCLLNLLLTFGVIRRLREHTAILASIGGSEDVFGLQAGQSPGAFSAVTIAGNTVSNASSLRMIAFLASFCSVCPERVPSFVEYVISHQIGRDSVLAVVAGDITGPPVYLDRLAGVAQVCFEPVGGEVGRAFGVRGFPVFALLDASGTLIASGPDPSQLAEPLTV
jgi:hypothetical protein